MKEVKLVDSAQLNFNLRGETPDGTAYVARALELMFPKYGYWFCTLGRGRGKLKLLYDEVIFVIEGCFELTANGQKYEVRPGQCCGFRKEPS